MRTLIFLLVLSPTLAAQENWPGFLGAGAGPVPNASVPTKWSPETLTWRVQTTGYGQSSPVIWGDQIYLTSVDGPEKETLYISCLSLLSGEEIWKKQFKSSYPEKNSVYISRAAPTPVLDEKGVYAYFESGDVIALTHDGNELWKASLSERYQPPQNKFGLSASPVQTEDRVVILIDDEGPSCLVALDKANGETLWKTERSQRKSWASPMLVPFGKSSQIVCSSDGTVDGYNIETGEKLWSFGEVGGNSSASPVPVGDGAFLVGAKPGRDGENSKLAKKSNGLFLVTKDGDDWNPRFAWKNPAPTASWGSPIAHNGFAYWVNRSGVVYCLDLSSGQVAYIERIKESCWATPVGVGDFVYIFGKSGMTTVLAAGEAFKIVEENALWTEENPPVNHLPEAEETDERRRASAALFSKPTVYGVAVAQGRIILRTGSELFCIHESKVALSH